MKELNKKLEKEVTKLREERQARFGIDNLLSGMTREGAKGAPKMEEEFPIGQRHLVDAHVFVNRKTSDNRTCIPMFDGS